MFSPQFRSHQETKMTARSNWTIWHLRSHGKIGDCEQSTTAQVVCITAMINHVFKLLQREFEISWHIRLTITGCYSSQDLNSVAHKWRHDSDKTQTNKLEWWMILKISLRAKGGVPKTLLEPKLRLNFLYFPQNTLMLTESREEFSDLHSIFRLRALR